MPPEKTSKRGKPDKLPYTSVIDSALGIGLTMDDIAVMSWGRLVMMLQAKAQSYKIDDGPREATFAEISAWAGVGLL